MKDAFGGVLNIVLIGVFLLIVEGVLGLVVNYSKAFRMKNIIISSYERFEGSGNCEINTDCYRKIVEQAKRIGYSKKLDLTCSQGFTNVDGYFCYLKSDSSSKKHYIFTVETQVDLSLPIVSKIMSLSFFKVRGDTRIIDKGNRVLRSE